MLPAMEEGGDNSETAVASPSREASLSITDVVQSNRNAATVRVVTPPLPLSLKAFSNRDYILCNIPSNLTRGIYLAGDVHGSLGGMEFTVSGDCMVHLLMDARKDWADDVVNVVPVGFSATGEYCHSSFGYRYVVYSQQFGTGQVSFCFRKGQWEKDGEKHVQYGVVVTALPAILTVTLTDSQAIVTTMAGSVVVDSDLQAGTPVTLGAVRAAARLNLGKEAVQLVSQDGVLLCEESDSQVLSPGANLGADLKH